MKMREKERERENEAGERRTRRRQKGTSREACTPSLGGSIPCRRWVCGRTEYRKEGCQQYAVQSVPSRGPDNVRQVINAKAGLLVSSERWKPHRPRCAWYDPGCWAYRRILYLALALEELGAIQPVGCH